jgi:hypothetical protein
MTVRAKMEVTSITKWKGQDQVKFNCVYTGTPEDNTFSQATPAGNAELTVSNPSLLGFFQPGDKFYLDFTKAE